MLIGTIDGLRLRCVSESLILVGPTKSGYALVIPSSVLSDRKYK